MKLTQKNKKRWAELKYRATNIKELPEKSESEKKQQPIEKQQKIKKAG